MFIEWAEETEKFADVVMGNELRAQFCLIRLNAADFLKIPPGW
jgi:hypothetical protein